jgi:hypothetical protein
MVKIKAILAYLKVLLAVALEGIGPLGVKQGWLGVINRRDPVSIYTY